MAAHYRRLEKAQELGWQFSVESEVTVPFHPTISEATSHSYAQTVQSWRTLYPLPFDKTGGSVDLVSDFILIAFGVHHPIHYQLYRKSRNGSDILLLARATWETPQHNLQFTHIGSGCVVAYIGKCMRSSRSRFGLMATQEGKPADLVLTIGKVYIKGDQTLLHQVVLGFGHGLDPVILFLALAFADDAFDDLTMERLLEMQRSQTGLRRMFKWRESVTEMPVFRQCERNGGVSRKRALTYQAISNCLRDLAQRSGFMERATFQAIRRATGNTIHGKVLQYDHRRVMTHRKSGTFDRFYASSISPVDTQSLVLGRWQRLDLTSQFLQTGCRHDEAVPQNLPDSTLEEIEGDRILQGYEDERARYLSELQYGHGSIKRSPMPEQRQYNALYERVRSQRNRLRKRALDKLQEDWAHEKEKTAPGLCSQTIPTDFDDYTTKVKIPQHGLYPLRRRIADGMFGYPKTTDVLDISLLSDLANLSRGLV
ncbi:unnamed protein product [Tuber aestivum]|uniref:Uncharacterized protein n=1 Tax=Tuber aestivum TaxID=59557 RepID=A0A292PJ84_9PEZI|nr:unnamed protein product [Tuber aestivum]